MTKPETASSPTEPLTGKVEMEVFPPTTSTTKVSVPYVNGVVSDDLLKHFVESSLWHVDDPQKIMAKEILSLRSSLSRAQERLKEAADIMQWLLDLQNGCPLEKYREDWERETARGYDFLHRLATEDTNEKGVQITCPTSTP